MTGHLLKTQGVADKLQVHIVTVYRYVASGELLPIRIGRALRFSEREVERFISSRNKTNRVKKL